MTALTQLPDHVRTAWRHLRTHRLDANGVAMWSACFMGLAGSALLAWPGPYSGLGFVAYLLSNAGWLTHGWRTRNWPMVVMQLGYTATSVTGIYKWLIA